ncbi:uracil-DNA glycosylase [Beggiatoa alba B18LD]|uniref:Uracil-DNA glycosylase n=1 Tax=Beggiatoa alba B18LD TaxID=395493 RepID=I3CE64_9GAMM|nr:uracil-DNA glycosylase family protein [Beggiatoa alba]EIJ41907.1 uracil-DNA glycosylase [Beggiatoa alba B18LD]
MNHHLNKVLNNIRDCQVCAAHLPYPPKPIIHIHSAQARLLIIGQAPSLKVQNTGMPWNDASGERLRTWLNMQREQFYNDPRIAIMPMGLCYSGTGTHGDLPPRPECAPLWHAKVIEQLTDLKLILLIGRYAQRYHLGKACKATLAQTVQSFADYAPLYFPLPHPSPRNLGWFKQHPWFADTVLPALQARLQAEQLTLIEG